MEFQRSFSAVSGSRDRGYSLGRGPRSVPGVKDFENEHNRTSSSLTPELGVRQNVNSFSSPGSARQKQKSEFHHYGSSLSLNNATSLSELTSRTLRPPSPSTLRKSASTISTSTPTRQVSRLTIPLAKVNLESPRLADYLERPRLVSTLSNKPSLVQQKSAVEASHHHAKRMMNNTSQYRNLRLGNFMEGPQDDDDELIPERLRQYYLETYLNVCGTCDSLTHSNPVPPVQRGM